jgi:hypothetical protein
MLLNKSHLKEEGYLADELIAESGISSLDRKCIVARQAIADGDFSLDQALEAYGLTKEQYSTFIANQLVLEMRSGLDTVLSSFNSHLDYSSRVLAVTASIAAIGEFYKLILGPVDKETQLIQDHLQILSQNVISGKVAV